MKPKMKGTIPRASIRSAVTRSLSRGERAEQGLPRPPLRPLREDFFIGVDLALGSVKRLQKEEEGLHCIRIDPNQSPENIALEAVKNGVIAGQMIKLVDRVGKKIGKSCKK